jgi:hypothetical protein
MSARKKSERRLHPRIKQKLPIRVAANGYDFATSTKDLSCVGAYCHIDKYIPPFTKVMVKLTLPLKHKNSSVECKGVLVRTEDEKKGGFNIAIFFNKIGQEQKKKIAEYVNQFISQDLSAYKRI